MIASTDQSGLGALLILRWCGFGRQDQAQLVAVPSLSALVMRALARALRDHNATSPPEQHAPLRMAVHGGEVAIDRHGATSAALTTAFRLLDSPTLKQVLADAPGELVLIVSRWIFDEVVRHSAVLDPATFRPVSIAVEELRDTAWIALPDHPYPADRTALDNRADPGGLEAWADGFGFGILGPVTIRHQGRELTVGSAQQRCVLALLLLDAGRVVSLDRLVDALWQDGTAPRTARNVVQKCISDLRRLLAADPEVRLIHKPPGYLLQMQPHRVDLHRFRALVRQADGAADRAAALRRALGLWRGEPLADVPGLEPGRLALAEERLATLENCHG